MITLLPFRPPSTDRWPATRVLLLVDYSNLLYQSYFSGSKSWVDRPWLPILRFMDSLRLCIQRSKVDGASMEVIFAGESRKKLERTKIDASYKAQRHPIDHDVFRHFRKIMALEIRSIPVLTGETAERFVREAEENERNPQRRKLLFSFEDIDRMMERSRKYLKEHGGKGPFAK